MENIMKTQLLVLLLLAAFNLNAQEIGDLKISVKALVHLEKIIKNDHGTEISIDNSEINIDTLEIREIAEVGRENLPYLLELMQVKELSFDTFCRCYSACSLIIKKINPARSLTWYGGAKIATSSSGISRIEPSGQANVQEFRIERINEIKLVILQIKTP